uniref:Ubiquitin-like domain-containing protein n=1 Tax=Callorhinchus milii TaxID=7868 RepID=A0A4W3JQS9_CALMI
VQLFARILFSMYRYILGSHYVIQYNLQYNKSTFHALEPVSPERLRLLAAQQPLEDDLTVGECGLALESIVTYQERSTLPYSYTLILS